MLYDKIILGAGLYGLYAARRCAQRGEKVLVIEYDNMPFCRATYINQARLHMGYHYPRSYSTAIKSAGYFNRFMEDFGFCINTELKKIYATSAHFSWTDAAQFRKFCADVGIKCIEVQPEEYFNAGMCDGAFLTTEYTCDMQILRDWFLKEIYQLPNAEICFNARLHEIKQTSSHFELILENGKCYATDFLINATYASANQIIKRLGYELFKIKYELCEVILCETRDSLRNVGITVMDGPFFSIMPFGKTGLHSLTTVTFTPHHTCYESLPLFECQEHSNGTCSQKQLGNCNICPAKPESAWVYMSHMAHKYLHEEYNFEYKSSLFSIKPILKISEIDDSRPTCVRKFSDAPVFIGILSGKINTVYDLESVL